jgi:geranylgeranyl diphosphate synthase type I
MDAKSFLEDYSKQADKYLKSFFAGKKKIGAKIDRTIVENLRIFEDYTSGGKKLRGALTVLGYQIAGGKNLNAIMPVSCGIELLHNFLLIHDDIIDKDELRRGKPTIHKFYSKGKSEHFGISKAIMVGDIGAFLGYELIVASDFPKARITKTLSKLNEYLLGTGYGQILDIEFDYKDEVSWDDILKVRTYKTAYYTFVMPLAVGAILGGASDKTLRLLEAYGIPVGIAFQLVDDILGVFGDPKKTGKSNESDIRDGKKTFLYAKTLELVEGKERRFLLKWYGSDKLDKEKISRIRKLFKNCGSLDYSRRLAKETVEEGKKYIPKIARTSQIRQTLSTLADFVVNRRK